MSGPSPGEALFDTNQLHLGEIFTISETSIDFQGLAPAMLDLHCEFAKQLMTIKGFSKTI